jgi:hypothetical protein
VRTLQLLHRVYKIPIRFNTILRIFSYLYEEKELINRMVTILQYCLQHCMERHLVIEYTPMLVEVMLQKYVRHGFYCVLDLLRQLNAHVGHGLIRRSFGFFLAHVCYFDPSDTACIEYLVSQMLLPLSIACRVSVMEESRSPEPSSTTSMAPAPLDAESLDTEMIHSGSASSNTKCESKGASIRESAKENEYAVFRQWLESALSENKQASIVAEDEKKWNTFDLESYKRNKIVMSKMNTNGEHDNMYDSRWDYVQLVLESDTGKSRYEIVDTLRVLFSNGASIPLDKIFGDKACIPSYDGATQNNVLRALKEWEDHEGVRNFMLTAGETVLQRLPSVIVSLIVDYYDGGHGEKQKEIEKIKARILQLMYPIEMENNPMILSKKKYTWVCTHRKKAIGYERVSLSLDL